MVLCAGRQAAWTTLGPTIVRTTGRSSRSRGVQVSPTPTEDMTSARPAMTDAVAARPGHPRAVIAFVLIVLPPRRVAGVGEVPSADVPDLLEEDLGESVDLLLRDDERW